MEKFTKILAISVLVISVGFSAGWGWGKKKTDEAAEKKTEIQAQAEPEIIEADKATAATDAVAEKVVEKVEESKEEPAVEVNEAAEVKAEKAVEAVADAPVVKVNGVALNESQVEKVVTTQLERIGSRIPPNMIDQYKQQIRKQAIEQMVVEELIMQRIKANNLVASDEEAEAEISAQLAGQNLTLDDFKALLNAYGTSYSEYQDNVKKKIAFDKLIEIEIPQGFPEPTVAEANEYYTQNPQQFEVSEGIQASHILIGVKTDDSNEAKAELKAKAEGLLKQIREEGADFAQLASENSSCPSSQKGGDLGMQTKGTFVPAFEKAAYALEPGEVSDVVETQFGYHIIKLIEHQDANTLSFDEAKEDIMMMLEGQAKQSAVMEYLDKIRKEAKIEYMNPDDIIIIPGLESLPPRPKAAPKAETAPAEPNAAEPNDVN